MRDTNPPPNLSLTSAPSGWTGQTFFNVSWDAVTDTNGIDHYESVVDYGEWTTVGSATNFITSSLSDGTHIAYVRAVDVPGNKGNISNISLQVDTTPPNTPFIREWHAGSNWTQHNTPYLSWSDPGDEGSGVTNYIVLVDNNSELSVGSNLSYHSPNLTTGIHTFSVKAYDVLNHSSNWSNTLTVFIDITVPEAPQLNSITHPNQNQWYADNNPFFTITPPEDDAGIEGYYYIIDKETNTTPDVISFWTTNTSLNISGIGSVVQIYANGTNASNRTGLVDGIWYMHIIAQDTAGNLGTNVTHYQMKIDTTGPAITEYSPANSSNFTDRMPPIQANYTDLAAGVNASTLQFLLDGIDYTQNSTFNDTSFIYLPTQELGADQHNLTLTIADHLGNVRNFSWLFHIFEPASNITIKGYGSGQGSSQNYNMTYTITDTPLGEKTNGNYTVQLGWPYYYE